MAKFEAAGLALKSKFICQFEFLENLEDIYGKCCWRARSCSPATFSIANLVSFIEIQIIIKSHSLMPGASNLAIFDVFNMLFPFLAFLKFAAHNFMKSRSHDSLAANGPLYQL